MAKKATVKKAKQPEIFKTISDEVGNLLTISNNGKRLLLSLKLIAETKKRRIGIVNLAQKVFEVKRNRAKHLFRANQSYGFNFKLLSDAKLFTNVRLSDDVCEWLIPKDFILTNGSFLHFKNNGGFEKQIFIELEKIKQFERPIKI